MGPRACPEWARKISPPPGVRKPDRPTHQESLPTTPPRPTPDNEVHVNITYWLRYGWSPRLRLGVKLRTGKKCDNSALLTVIGRKWRTNRITLTAYEYSELYHLTDYNTRVGTLIVATIYVQLIQNRYMFRSFTVLQCSHQHCVQPVASDVEVVGYL